MPSDDWNASLKSAPTTSTCAKIAFTSSLYILKASSSSSFLLLYGSHSAFFQTVGSENTDTESADSDDFSYDPYKFVKNLRFSVQIVDTVFEWSNDDFWVPFLRFWVPCQKMRNFQKLLFCVPFSFFFSDKAWKTSNPPRKREALRFILQRSRGQWLKCWFRSGDSS